MALDSPPGAGIGLALTPVSTDAVNRAPGGSYGEVTGVTQTVRYYASSLSLAVLGTILIKPDQDGHQHLTRARGTPETGCIGDRGQFQHGSERSRRTISLCRRQPGHRLLGAQALPRLREALIAQLATPVVEYELTLARDGLTSEASFVSHSGHYDVGDRLLTPDGTWTVCEIELRERHSDRLTCRPFQAA